LEIVEVMRLAGHSKYETTLKYYLHVKDDLVDKARRAIKHKVSREMLERRLGIGEYMKTLTLAQCNSCPVSHIRAPSFWCTLAHRLFWSDRAK
jgi:hypothetical protein